MPHPDIPGPSVRPRRKPASRFRAGLLSLALALAGCLSGTSTESENTVRPGSAGRARFSAGAPAAGARVSIRTREVVRRGDSLAWRLVADAIADSEGRFRIALPDTGEIFLVVRAAGGTEGNPAGGALPCRLLQFDAAAPRPKDLGDVVLMAAGAVTGRLAPLSGYLPPALWVGVPGTELLIKITGPGQEGILPFRIQGIPYGARSLVAVVPKDTGIAQYLTNAKLNGNLATSGETIDLKEIIYEDRRAPGTP